MPVTIKDVARMSGTSPTAVSFVLNDKDARQVSAENRDRILKAVERLGYRRHPAARALRSGKTQTIALSVRGLPHQYPVLGQLSHHELVECVSRNLGETGYSMLISHSPAGGTAAEALAPVLREAVDGVLLERWPEDVLEEIVAVLDRLAIPAVSVGTRLRRRHGWCAIDRLGALRSALQYLLKQRLKRICLLYTWPLPAPDAPRVPLPPQESPGSYERFYREALSARGLKPIPPFRVPAVSMEGCVETVERMLRAVPDMDGLLLTDNFLAHIVVDRLRGRPIRIIGYGDARFADLCWPRLSYLRLPTEALAQTATRMLLSMINGGGKADSLGAVLPCDLVIQDT